MVVRLRLSRFECRNNPFYRIMVADSRYPRDDKHLEVLGYYNLQHTMTQVKMTGKRMGLHFDRMKYLKDLWMESEDDPVKKELVVEARARNMSHNVRSTECGSQSIEDSQADIAILLRKLIWDGKPDKEIYKKLGEEYGETMLYEPKFDLQTAGL